MLVRFANVFCHRVLRACGFNSSCAAETRLSCGVKSSRRARPSASHGDLSLLAGRLGHAVLVCAGRHRRRHLRDVHPPGRPRLLRLLQRRRLVRPSTAWYKWYPDYAYDFTGISFSAGDSVTVTVTASSTKAGTAVIKNNTKGTSVTKSITSTAALCEKDAEWIVEDYEEGSSLVPLANFGTVTFTGASAGTASRSVGPSGAEIIDLEQNNKVLTSVTTSSNSVTVKYTGS